MHDKMVDFPKFGHILVKPGSHFKFGPLEKIADIFGRDMGANFFRNGSWNSILPSNLASRRVVMELRYMTILIGCIFDIQNQWKQKNQAAKDKLS